MNNYNHLISDIHYLERKIKPINPQNLLLFVSWSIGVDLTEILLIVTAKINFILMMLFPVEKQLRMTNTKNVKVSLFGDTHFFPHKGQCDHGL